jgi:predicted flap endonuclease-1-like 5' DNA nuclease
VLIVSIVIIITAFGVLAGYAFGVRRTARDVLAVQPASPPAPAPLPTGAGAMPLDDPAAAIEREHIDQEKARIIRSQEAEGALLRERVYRQAAAADPAPDVAAIERALLEARAETARYRQLVIDIENNAPPPILQGAAEPDDLKLIVGVGPVLERMLRNLGVTTFRQIARWTSREVAEFDAKLPEFPGRIVRDQWVTQARALHESKYGESALGRPS